MVGARYCSSCKSTHEGVMGKKSTIFCSIRRHHRHLRPLHYSSRPAEKLKIRLKQQTANSWLEAAHQQPPVTSVTNPVCKTPSYQNFKKSQRFGYLQQQAAKDRYVSSGLVSEFWKQGEALQRMLSQSQAASIDKSGDQSHSSISAFHIVSALLH